MERCQRYLRYFDDETLAATISQAIEADDVQWLRFVIQDRAIHPQSSQIEMALRRNKKAAALICECCNSDHLFRVAIDHGHIQTVLTYRDMKEAIAIVNATDLSYLLANEPMTAINLFENGCETEGVLSKIYNGHPEEKLWPIVVRLISFPRWCPNQEDFATACQHCPVSIIQLCKRQNPKLVCDPLLKALQYREWQDDQEHLAVLQLACDSLLSDSIVGAITNNVVKLGHMNCLSFLAKRPSMAFLSTDLQTALSQCHFKMSVVLLLGTTLPLPQEEIPSRLFEKFWKKAISRCVHVLTPIPPVVAKIIGSYGSYSDYKVEVATRVGKGKLLTLDYRFL
jgi:hypothetical protein